MTEAVPDLPKGVTEADLSDEDQHRRRVALLAQHSEAARAGFFAVGKDMLETMQASGKVPESAACVMTGALEMAVQLWVEVGAQVGIPPKTVKRNFQKEVGRFFRKHERLQERAKAAAKKGAIEA
jgi:hypothetical protein